MRTTSFFSRAQIVGLVLAVVALIACIAIYSGREETYPAATHDSVYVENPGVLEDWLAPETYNAAINHIEYYLASNNVDGKAILISDRPYTNATSEVLFTFNTDLDPTQHSVILDTASYGSGVTSTSVNIDDEQSVYKSVDRLYDAKFKQFDSLTDNALTGVQAYAVQSLLVQSLPGNNYVLSPSSINTVNSSSVVTTRFDVTVDGKEYHLKNVSRGLSDVDLTVRDAANKPVFHATKDLVN